MTFRNLVLAALDAADVAPNSAVWKIAVDRVTDVGSVVAKGVDNALYYNEKYGVRLDRFPVPECPQIAAVNLVLLAMSEAARGVRVVGRQRF